MGFRAARQISAAGDETADGGWWDHKTDCNGAGLSPTIAGGKPQAILYRLRRYTMREAVSNSASRASQRPRWTSACATERNECDDDGVCGHARRKQRQGEGGVRALHAA